MAKKCPQCNNVRNALMQCSQCFTTMCQWCWPGGKKAFCPNCKPKKLVLPDEIKV